jgi:hypothetical protein
METIEIVKHPVNFNQEEIYKQSYFLKSFFPKTLLLPLDGTLLTHLSPFFHCSTHTLGLIHPEDGCNIF